MAISDATRLADFATGVGTDGTLDLNNVNATGIGTFATVVVGGAVTSTIGGITVTGVVTATSFSGSGANLTGVSGFATALSNTGPKQQIFTTNRSMTIGAGTSCYVKSTDAAGNIAFTRLGRIHVASGATFQVGSGTTLVMDVLGVFS